MQTCAHCSTLCKIDRLFGSGFHRHFMAGDHTTMSFPTELPDTRRCPQRPGPTLSYTLMALRGLSTDRQSKLDTFWHVSTHEDTNVTNSVLRTCFETQIPFTSWAFAATSPVAKMAHFVTEAAGFFREAGFRRMKILGKRPTAWNHDLNTQHGYLDGVMFQSFKVILNMIVCTVIQITSLFSIFSDFEFTIWFPKHGGDIFLQSCCQDASW